MSRYRHMYLGKYCNRQKQTIATKAAVSSISRNVHLVMYIVASPVPVSLDSKEIALLLSRFGVLG